MAEERTYCCGPEKCLVCGKPWDGLGEIRGLIKNKMVRLSWSQGWKNKP